MNYSETPPIINSVLPFIGVFLGGLITFGTQWHLKSRENKILRENLTRALLAEISSIVELIAHRDHISSLKEHIENYPKDLDPNCVYQNFYFNADASYLQIYKSNLSSIGMIKNPADFVSFYSKAFAFLHDLETCREHNGKNTPLRKEYFEGMKILLEEIVKDGREIMRNRNSVCSYTHICSKRCW